MKGYPKRLIEVDLPIRRISEHARREKYLSTITSLHLWWARRPLGACRAVICASLWPDPADPLCPKDFRVAATRILREFARNVVSNSKLANEHCSPESFRQWTALAATQNAEAEDSNEKLRAQLLDFIADFANWDNAAVKAYLSTSRALTKAAHLALGGKGAEVPLVVDPFAGGGSIPFEALRVGADSYATDINPVPVLLNKVVLEYIPKFGARLAGEVEKLGAEVDKRLSDKIEKLYPKDESGGTAIAYLWARTVECEGPGCGTEIPLLRSLWLGKKGRTQVALQLIGNRKNKVVEFRIISRQKDGWREQGEGTKRVESPVFEGTVKRGSATCPCCGYTTPVARVREQLRKKSGGTRDARMLCAVTTRADVPGRFYRLLNALDEKALKQADTELARLLRVDPSELPDEETPGTQGHRAVGSLALYGMTTWGSVFSARQAVAMLWLSRIVSDVVKSELASKEVEFVRAVKTCLSLAVSRESDHLNSGCSWNPTGEKMQHLFARQALPMVWDFCETNPLGGSVGSWRSVLDCITTPLRLNPEMVNHGQAECAAAIKHPLPDGSASAFITDPPYYDSIPYAELADFFYVWLKRLLKMDHPDLFAAKLTPKKEQAIVWHPGSAEERKEFERKMGLAMSEGARILVPSGIGVVVFAHKSTRGWETQLQAMIDGGWIITGSWPIDSELGTRVNAQGTASLSSSIHLVCRPRKSTSSQDVGDWRDVLHELPLRIHEWMPRLASEGVVGADAIFACLGPALEIYSRYSRVEKANGDLVLLKEYLEHVWAAVSKEALTMIFSGADATGFEEDARLTAIWLWTISTAGRGEDLTSKVNKALNEVGDDDVEEALEKSKTKLKGFFLEYDAARKISQGLGANLEGLPTVVEVSGDQARLLPVGERAKFLMGREDVKADAPGRSPSGQIDFLMGSDEGIGSIEHGEAVVGDLGRTVLDRIHQSMILFGAGRGEALKRFLVQDGVGRDQRFWGLAQALSALYPGHADEKRWIDGVLARKKGLGF